MADTFSNALVESLRHQYAEGRSDAFRDAATHLRLATTRLVRENGQLRRQFSPAARRALLAIADELWLGKGIGAPPEAT